MKNPSTASESIPDILVVMFAHRPSEFENLENPIFN